MKQKKQTGTVGNIYPGFHGSSDLKKMTVGSVFEGKQSIYNMEDSKAEDRLFEINNEVRNLMESLRSFNLEKENEDASQ